MRDPFNCSPNVRNNEIDIMVKFALCFLILSGSVFGQAQPSMEKMNKDALLLESAVNDAVSTTIPGFGPALQNAKGAYLEGYGVVVTLEVALEPPRLPFGGVKSPEEVRKTVSQRRKDVMDRLTSLLKQRTPALESVAATESVAIILNLLNTNPADTPDLPAQIILSVKKQDADSARINIREYK